MKKLLKPRELIGTGIQLMIVGLLLPFICILLGIMMESAPGAKDDFLAAVANAVLSELPFAETIQNVITGLDLSQPGISFLEYGLAILETLEGNMIAATYLGMWLYAFRLIFKEILGDVLHLYGLPILQIFCGLFFGALTFVMIQDPMLKPLVIVFVYTLNIVLTFVFVDKAKWKKFLEVFINLSLQCYLAALTIGYVVVIMCCLKGVFTNVAQAVALVVIVTLLWIIYLVAQYLLTEK